MAGKVISGLAGLLSPANIANKMMGGAIGLGTFSASVQGFSGPGYELQAREGIVSARSTDYEMGQLSRTIRDLGTGLLSFRETVQKVTSGLGATMSDHLKFISGSMRELNPSGVKGIDRLNRADISAGDSIRSARMSGMNLDAYGQSIGAMRSSGAVGSYGASQGYRTTESGFNREFARAIGVGAFGTLRDQALQNVAATTVANVAAGGRGTASNAIDTQVAIFQAAQGVGQRNGQRDASLLSYGTNTMQAVQNSNISRGAFGSLAVPGMMMAAYDAVRPELLKSTEEDLASVDKQIGNFGTPSTETQQAELEGLQSKKANLEKLKKTYSTYDIGPAALNRALRMGDPKLTNAMNRWGTRAFGLTDEEALDDDSDKTGVIRSVLATGLQYQQGAAATGVISQVDAAARAPVSIEAATRAGIVETSASAKKLDTIFGTTDNLLESQNFKSSLMAVIGTRSTGSEYQKEIGAFIQGSGAFKNQDVKEDAKKLIGTGETADKRTKDIDEIVRFVQTNNTSTDASGAVKWTGAQDNIRPANAGVNQLTAMQSQAGDATLSFERLGSTINDYVQNFSAGNDNLTTAMTAMNNAVASGGEGLTKALASITSALLQESVRMAKLSVGALGAAGGALPDIGLTVGAAAAEASKLSPKEIIDDIAKLGKEGAAAVSANTADAWNNIRHDEFSPGSKANDTPTMPQKRAFGGPVFAGMTVSAAADEVFVPRNARQQQGFSGASTIPPRKTVNNAFPGQYSDSYGKSIIADSDSPRGIMNQGYEEKTFVPTEDGYVIAAKDVDEAMMAGIGMNMTVDPIHVQNAEKKLGLTQSRLKAMALEAGKRENIDPRLIFSIMYQESQFVPEKKTKFPDMAQGLMQVWPMDDNTIPGRNNPDLLATDHDFNVNAGAKILGQFRTQSMTSKNGPWTQTIQLENGESTTRSFTRFDQMLMRYLGAYEDGKFTSVYPKANLEYLDRVKQGYIDQGGELDWTSTLFKQHERSGFVYTEDYVRKHPMQKPERKSPYDILDYLGDPNERASGGPVLRNSPTIVGERGPELFMPGSSGRVLPNDFMNAIGSNTQQSSGQISHKMIVEFVTSDGSSLGSQEIDLMAAISHYSVVNPTKEARRTR